MATAEQVKSLIRSHFSKESERFYTIALQLAAHEAKQGHTGLAHDIRTMIDMERKKTGPGIISFPRDLKGLVLTENSQISTLLPRACHKKQEIFLSGLLTWVGGMARFGY
jgi:hypothetical protein